VPSLPTRPCSSSDEPLAGRLSRTGQLGTLAVGLGAMLLAVMLSGVVACYAVRRGKPPEAAAARLEPAGER
jgi:hypothetical protein